MKSKEEIEKLAEQRFPTDNSDRFKNVDFSSLKIGFFEGYSNCQEDMAKKYTEEDLLHAFREGVLLPNSQIGIMEDIFKQVVQSLNKQD